MKRDSGLGECPECTSTSVIAIGRPPHPALLVSPLLASVSATMKRDLLCKECGARWSLSDAERTDPWADNRPHFPHTPADDVDEADLDAKWERWGQDH